MEVRMKRNQFYSLINNGPEKVAKFSLTSLPGLADSSRESWPKTLAAPLIINSYLVSLPDGTLLDCYTRYEMVQELDITIAHGVIEYRDLFNFKIEDELFSARLNGSPGSHRSRLRVIDSERCLRGGRGVCRQRKWESEMGIFRGELVTLR